MKLKEIILTSVLLTTFPSCSFIRISPPIDLGPAFPPEERLIEKYIFNEDTPKQKEFIDSLRYIAKADGLYVQEF